MSRQRQTARAQREAAAVARADADRSAQLRAASARERRERRTQLWRRLRLWQHGPRFRRNREAWGALASAILLILLVVFIVTRSVGAVLGTALICVIAAPVLVSLLFDRSRK